MKNIIVNNYKIVIGIALLLLLVIVGIPLLIEHIIIRNNVYSVVSNNEWVTFLGSYLGGIIGGIITLGGVLLTLKFYRNQEENANKNKRNKDIIAIYWFITYKITILNSWHDVYLKCKDDEFLIPVGKIIDDDDFMFLLTRIQSAHDLEGDDIVDELMELFSRFDSLQLAHKLLSEAYIANEDITIIYDSYGKELNKTVDAVKTDYAWLLERLNTYLNEGAFG